MVGVVVYLSLTPSVPKIPPLPAGDKIGHLLAYTILMLWFGFIYLRGSAYLGLGIGLILMGLILEVIQGCVGYRSFDYFDMFANTLGVLSGWLLAGTRLASTLLYVEGRLPLGGR